MKFDRLLYTIPEGRALLGGMSNSQFYKLVAQDRIQTVKVGRRSYLTAEEITRFVESLSSDGERPAPDSRDRSPAAYRG